MSLASIASVSREIKKEILILQFHYICIWKLSSIFILHIDINTDGNLSGLPSFSLLFLLIKLLQIYLVWIIRNDFFVINQSTEVHVCMFKLKKLKYCKNMRLIEPFTLDGKKKKVIWNAGFRFFLYSIQTSRNGKLDVCCETSWKWYYQNTVNDPRLICFSTFDKYKHIRLVIRQGRLGAKHMFGVSNIVTINMKINSINVYKRSVCSENTKGWA